MFLRQNVSLALVLLAFLTSCGNPFTGDRIPLGHLTLSGPESVSLSQLNSDKSLALDLAYDGMGLNDTQLSAWASVDGERFYQTETVSRYVDGQIVLVWPPEVLAETPAGDFSVWFRVKYAPDERQVTSTFKVEVVNDLTSATPLP